MYRSVEDVDSACETNESTVKCVEVSNSESFYWNKVYPEFPKRLKNTYSGVNDSIQMINLDVRGLRRVK